MYAHYGFHMVNKGVVPDVNTEHQIVPVSPRWNPDMVLCHRCVQES